MPERPFSADFDVEFIGDLSEDAEVFQRCIGPNGAEWRSKLYNLPTYESVLEHFAYNAVRNGVTRASSL